MPWCAAAAFAGTLYTFGADGGGVPASLNSMDPAAPASVTNLQASLDGGNTGFNGGLVAVSNLLYAIGNDSLGVATLYSTHLDGSGLAAVSSAFNTSGGAAGVVFQNGLASTGSAFYAIGQGATTKDLYQIGSGTATLIQTLNTFNGSYTGLAWDSTLNGFYAVIAGASGAYNGDLLASFPLGGSASVVANLSTLDAAPAGTHLGGLADAGGGILYDIYTNGITFTGEIEQLDVSGGPSAVTLYDSGIPLAQNAGLAFLPSPSAAVPEPSVAVEIGSALLLLGWRLRKRS